ncbi:hypothetical protein [Mycolicibacter sinensis]|uniref:Transmembrane protein n=1 Tax=Mycolicibacter sinensis (strain JDM601) TaxID=875328 RepID=A0A1A2NHR6_MYCSD|nr:hypothetical protein [Mycolicibacter sinensis]OBH14615.1 hypothetical protein A5694_11970 [Mycolicibacter sinensis]OBI32079.1 hypothetical protein A5710_16530 [Mycolicibacter sinensis]
MTRLQLVKPSFRRLLWSTAAAALAAWFIAGSALFVGALLVSSDDPIPTQTGDYIRLYFVAIVMWGPALLLLVWFSVPVIVALGALIASMRRETGACGEQPPWGR